MLFLKQRPSHYLPAQHYRDADALVQALHALIDDSRPYHSELEFNGRQMAYAGELLEELRSFRPQGAAQLDAALPALIEHAEDKRRVDLLLCLKDSTTQPELQQEIKHKIDLWLTISRIVHSPETTHHLREVIMDKANQAPLAMVDEMQERSAQLGAARADIRLRARHENEAIYCGRMSMRMHRMLRLSNNQPLASGQQDRIAALLTNLEQQKGTDIAIALLGWNLTEPGNENSLYAKAEQMAEAANPQLQTLPHARAAFDYKKYIHPIHYAPIETMKNAPMLRQLYALADKHTLKVMDEIRVGELLAGFTVMGGEMGRQMLQREQKKLIQHAVKSGNTAFLCALGQATTAQGELLTTLPALNTLLHGDAAKYMDPAYLIGRWNRKQTAEQCNEALADLVENAQQSDRALLGMHLGMHRFFTSLHADIPHWHDYDGLMLRAEAAHNLLGMTAMGYALSAPGERLENWGRIHAEEQRQLHSIKAQRKEQGEQAQEAAPKAARMAGLAFPEPQDNAEAAKWLKRYTDQLRTTGGAGFQLN